MRRAKTEIFDRVLAWRVLGPPPSILSHFLSSTRFCCIFDVGKMMPKFFGEIGRNRRGNHMDERRNEISTFVTVHIHTYRRRHGKL